MQIWLHHFSDASQDGYGQFSYLRMVNNKDEDTLLPLNEKGQSESLLGGLRL